MKHWLIKRGVMFSVLMLALCTPFAYGNEADPNTVTSEISTLSDYLKDSENSGTALTESLHRMMVAVVIVVVLGLAAIYASKKVLPKFSRMQGKKIKILETLPLGSRKSLYLLDVSGHQILIASTHDRITKLAELTEGFSLDAFSSEQSDIVEDES